MSDTTNNSAAVAPVPPDDAAPGQAGAVPVSSPTRPIPGDDKKGPQPGVALCLSGGGYRAMLFHLGTLWRLNDLGELGKLARVSSVSGGSIVAGLLGLRWNTLGFDAQTGRAPSAAFVQHIVEPIRALASRTIDAPAIGLGTLLPGSIGDYVIGAYRKHLFGDATLQNLPTDAEGPRFILNATNVQSGVLWRFSRPYMGDWRVGLVDNPTLLLAAAVGASAAFPPFLSPVVLDLDPSQFRTVAGTELTEAVYRDRVVLTDGGVYDNLGLETAWKHFQTVLVSDAGGRNKPNPEPRGDWARHGADVVGLLYGQVGSLRVRQVVDSLKAGDRTGAYWSSRSDASAFAAANALPTPFSRTDELAAVETRLRRLDDLLQERLINWGYAACDGAVRAYWKKDAPAPANFPYPRAGV